jgi:glycosyltransferase involved in cell wall biosynthesis
MPFGMNKVKLFSNIIKNMAVTFNSGLTNGNKYNRLLYIIEGANWSIQWDGKYITDNLNSFGLIKANTSLTYVGVRNQIIHFGSLNTFLTNKGFKKPHWSNKVFVTYFHLVPNDPRLKFIKEAEKYVDFFHTSCNITKKNLIDIGVKPEKIIVIPLGVDLSLFKPVSFEEKQKTKKQLGIPQDKIVIGSFQKDGVGWGEGLEPKWIKGPDVFVEVVGKLAKNYPVFILLAGPARGYIKNGLEKLKIPHKSIGYLKNLTEVAQYYHALDLYLITSRIEGGPKAILESWASGVPLVTTKAGMAPDVIKDGENGFLINVEDVNALVGSAGKVLNDVELKNKFIKNGLETVKNYSWKNIAVQYYEKVYSKLI